MLESRQKIEIPLKTIAGLEHKKLAPNIRQTIENEYATKYLERIGVHPTKEKMEFMLSNMPVEVSQPTICVSNLISRKHLLSLFGQDLHWSWFQKELKRQIQM
jgi:hypothetical protein